ncbi:uncharacterized protein LOC120331267 [Styela clava]|uniref:cell number regulator 2-like n=1 Tax=Styela clava TaxID=7725 RepID=UPI00193A5A4D|nr:cell number regulator 2-like [Styela clava]
MGEFQHGLCGCFDNITLCLISYIAPCYTVGKTAEAVGDDCLLCGAGYMFGGCIIGGLLRGKVREQKGIDGSPVMDFLIHCFCPLCAIIQDNQEVVTAGMGASMARV